MKKYTLIILITAAIGLIYCAKFAQKTKFEPEVYGAIKAEPQVDWTKKNGPEKYYAYHQEIRTNFGASSPGYKANDVFDEYQKAVTRNQDQVFTREELDWKSRGPSNVGGRTRGIWVDPSDETMRTIYGASAGGGVWKTEDGGGQWRHLTESLPVLSTTTIAGSPADPNILYVGTGEGFGASTEPNILGSGMWKSVDAGESWSQLSNTADQDTFSVIYRIIVNPDDANHLYFSGLTNTRLPDGLGFVSFIARSFDGGETIEIIRKSQNAFQQILADHQDFNILYATELGVGIRRSDDGGRIWRKIYNRTDGRIEMAVSQVNPKKLFASIATGELFASDNTGFTWNRVDIISGNSNVDWMGGQGWYDNTIYTHPYNEDIVYVGGAGPVLEVEIESYAQQTGVKLPSSWKPVIDGYGQFQGDFLGPVTKGVHVDFHNLITIPMDTAAKTFAFIIGNDGGVAISYDNGDTFLQTGDHSANDIIYNDTSSQNVIQPTGTGYVTSQFYGVDKMNGADRYIGGTQDNGSWISGINPINSSKWNTTPGGDGFEAVWNYNNTDLIIESSQNGTLFKSVNGGESWFFIGVPGGNKPFITVVSGSQQNSDFILTPATQGIAKSADFGTTWSVTSMPPQWTYNGLKTPVEISLANPLVAWSGTALGNENRMCVSTNAGGSFKTINAYTEANLGRVTTIASHPFNDSIAYFLFSQSDGPKVIKTTDLGNTFEDITGFVTNTSESSNGFPDVSVYSLLVMPHDTSIIWVGSEIGIIESTDSGATWHLAENGLPPLAIWEMKVVNDEVVVATHGQGIWTVSIPELESYTPFTIDAKIDVETVAFNGNVLGNYAINERVDSAKIILNYLFNGEEITEEFTLAGAEGPSAEDYSFIIEKLPDEAIIQGDVFLLTFRDGLKAAAISTNSVTIFKVDDDPIDEEFYTKEFEEADSDFARKGFELTKPTPFTNKALHSPHPYPNLSEFIAIFQKPIVVSEKTSSVTFDEIALIEPGEAGVPFGQSEFWDYALIEGTIDRGKSWTFIEAYDARLHPAWSNVYQGNACDTPANISGISEDLIINHELNLLDHFAASDTVFLRFTMVTDPCSEGWGWMIDNFTVGKMSTAVNNQILADGFSAQVLQNPVDQELSLIVNTDKTEVLQLQLMNMAGQILERKVNVKIRQGRQVLQFDMSQYYDGIYFVRLQKEGFSDVIKIIKS